MPQVSQILPFVFYNLRYVPFITSWMTVPSAETNRYSKLCVRNIRRTCTLEPQYSCNASTTSSQLHKTPSMIQLKNARNTRVTTVM